MLMIQINIFMLILLGGIVLHARRGLNKKEEVHRSFLAMAGLTIVILVLEILSVVLNSDKYIDFIFVSKIVNILGFVLAPLLPLAASWYAWKWINKEKAIEFNGFTGLLCVPFVVNGLVSLGSYHFNWIFSITPENIYVRGPLFLISPLTCYFYYMLNWLFLYVKRSQVSRYELIVLSLLTILPTIFSGFQLYYFIFLTIWNSLGVAVVINYIFLVHSQSIRDALTGLGNRLAYDKYLESLKGNKNIRLAVVYIDIDGFKSINDTLGHEVGDQTLKFFARQLEETFSKSGIAIRLGGDEFIVLMKENRKRVVEEYVARLKERIQAYNDCHNSYHNIQLSCGIAIYDDSYEDLYALIRYSDQLMYEDKRKKQRRCFNNI